MDEFRNPKYSMVFSPPTFDRKEEGERSFSKKKLNPGYHEEVVTLVHGPRDGTETIITKGVLNERYTDNSYSEFGLTQYWHSYKRDSYSDKRLYYDGTQFDKFIPYINFRQTHLDALEKDIISVLKEVKKGL